MPATLVRGPGGRGDRREAWGRKRLILLPTESAEGNLSLEGIGSRVFWWSNNISYLQKVISGPIGPSDNLTNLFRIRLQ